MVASVEIVESRAGTNGSNSSGPTGSHAMSEAALFAHDKQATVISKRPPPIPAQMPRAMTLHELGQSLEGERLGHFQLGEFVGGGGMGAVFRATDMMLDRTVAVKILSRDQTDQDTLRRFKNEAQSAARLDHPNIARVYYVGEDKGWNYIVFEFIEGANVRELVEQRGPLPLEEAISFTMQVAEALEHAFRRDVVHRDIKPSNVLVMPDNHVKLVDMGLARLHQVAAPENDLTASGVTLGTFDYISPEQARDPRSADVRSDIYSLGCTLYYMLTARPPFPDGTVLQKLLSHTSDDPPDPRLLRPDLPEEVSVVLQKMLAKQPAQRYQQPSELIGELLLLADQLGLQGAARGGRVWITSGDQRFPAWERHLPWAVPLVALLVIVFGLDFFWPSAEYSADAIGPPILPKQTVKAEVAPRAAPNEQQAVTPAVTNEPIVNDGANSPTTEPVPTTVPEVRPGDNGGTPAVAGANNSVTTPTVSPAEPPVAVTPLPSEGTANTGTAPTVPLPTENGSAPNPTPPAVPPTVATDNTGQTQPATVETVTPPPANSVTEPIVVREPRVLIVGRSDLPHPADAVVVHSLEMACQQAAEMPNLEAIELHFNGEWEERPFKIAAKLLKIRAGAGYAPLIVFRPKERDLAPDGGMMQVLGSDLRWEGVHLRMQLPAEPIAGNWSLFHMDRAIGVSLVGCTLTIQNVNANGYMLQDDVAFFEIQGPTAAGIMPQADENMQPAIELNRCIARGDACFVRADNIQPCSLNWDQGLFISSQRLMEIGGAVEKPNWFGNVQVDLRHVTAMMRKGMFLLTTREDARYLLPLDVDNSDCIFLTDPASAQVDFVVVQSVAEIEEKFLPLDGKRNFYPDTNVFTRIKSLSGSQQTKEITFEQRDDKMSVEKMPRKMVMWRGLPAPDAPLHTLTKQDFLLSEHSSNPALRSADNHGAAGFDPTQLPDFPPKTNQPAPAPAASRETGGQE
jgi:serine/threonine protein kinase